MRRRPLRGHPITRDRFRATLAHISLPVLVAGFLAIIAVSAAALAIGFVATRQAGEPSSFIYWWRQAFLELVTFPAGPTLQGSGTGRDVMQILAASMGLVLPGLFLGSVVFRLLVSPKIFVFRRMITLMEPPGAFRVAAPGSHVLAVRGYSATRLKLLDLRFSAIFQHDDPQQRAVRINRPLPVLNPRWPLADRHVPYTLFIPLHAGDVTAAGKRPALRSIEQMPIGPTDTLVIHVSGRIPALGGEFVERHTFSPSEHVSDEAYGDVTVFYDQPSRQWRGWPGFEG